MPARSTRSDNDRLLDMIGACEIITDYVSRYHEDEQDVFRDAILHHLTLIGEAVANIDDELKARHPTIPWATIKAFRNVLVHEYFSVRWDRVWDAVDRIPSLVSEVRNILQIEFE